MFWGGKEKRKENIACKIFNILTVFTLEANKAKCVPGLHNSNNRLALLLSLQFKWLQRERSQGNNQKI